jgi:SSS family solute:Na+ symporter
VGIIVSHLQGAEEHPKAIAYKDVDTSTSSGFNIAALVVILMLAALYATWW